MSTIVESLTKNIVSRDLQKLKVLLSLNKWEKTGLLEGLDNERNKNIAWRGCLKIKQKSFFAKQAR